jgi:hypothetical protein
MMTPPLTATGLVKPRRTDVFRPKLRHVFRKLLAQLVKCGVEVAYVSYTTQALPSRRFSLRTIFAQRGGAERGNSSHPTRPCRPCR